MKLIALLFLALSTCQAFTLRFDFLKSNPKFDAWANEARVKLSRNEVNLKHMEKEGQAAITNKYLGWDNYAKLIIEQTERDLSDTRVIRRELIASRNRSDLTEANKKWINTTLLWIEQLTARQEVLIDKLRLAVISGRNQVFALWALDTNIDIQDAYYLLGRLEKDVDKVKNDASKKKEMREIVEFEVAALKKIQTEADAWLKRTDLKPELTKGERQHVNGVKITTSQYLERHAKLLIKLR